MLSSWCAGDRAIIEYQIGFLKYKTSTAPTDNPLSTSAIGFDGRVIGASSHTFEAYLSVNIKEDGRNLFGGWLMHQT
jgi:hypothetical protein